MLDKTLSNHRLTHYRIINPQNILDVFLVFRIIHSSTFTFLSALHCFGYIFYS